MFNSKYIVRRFGEQKNVRGYIAYPHTDFEASLHIHPTGSDQIIALPEGQRRVKRLEGHGEIELFTANADTGRKADLLYYRGDWYECVNSQPYDRTILAHWNYQFVIIPKDAHGTVDTEPPEGM